MREQYNNGDDVGLVHNGCDGCSIATINGEVCHERNCPEAWRDELAECSFCDTEFYPEFPGQSCCDEDCLNAYY